MDIVWLLVALGYFIAFPAMFILAWNYMRIFQKFKGTCAFVDPRNRDAVDNLRLLRASIHNRLNELLK